MARDPETSPAAFLGAELRRARMAAGFSSQDALATRLGFDRTVITKAETPHVIVQVIPSDVGANAGLSGAFDIASGDGGPEVVRMETVQDVTVENRSIVRMAANTFVHVQADALSRAASRALITEAAEQWKTR